MRLRMERLPRQQTPNYILWYSSLFESLNFSGRLIRRKCRRMGSRNHSLRMCFRRRAFQDNPFRGLDQNSSRQGGHEQQ